VGFARIRERTIQRTILWPGGWRGGGGGMGPRSPSRSARQRHSGPEWERLLGWPVRSRRWSEEPSARPPPRHPSAAYV